MDVQGLTLRDLGGWRARGGRVRSGLLFRTTQLPLTEMRAEKVMALRRAGIRVIFDLRTEQERANRADEVPRGVDYVAIDVMRDLPGGMPAQLVQAISDPKAAERMLGSRQDTLFEQGYREMVSVPGALTGYSRLFSELAEPWRRPALLHCTTGKDRTGWAAAALLLLLGVEEDDVYADYLLTNRRLLPTMRPVIDLYVAEGSDADLLTRLLSVETEYLDIAVEEMRQRFGSIEGYFFDGLRLDSVTIERLRAAFIEQHDG